MKKTYESPKMSAVLLHGPKLMLNGSDSVNDYKRGSDITAGDSD